MGLLPPHPLLQDTLPDTGPSIQGGGTTSWLNRQLLGALGEPSLSWCPQGFIQETQLGLMSSKDRYV